MKKIKVFLVDDSKFHIEGAKLVLKGNDRIEVVGEACSEQHALELMNENRPDVALIDIKLGSGQEGIRLAAQLRKCSSKIKIIMFSHYSSSYLIIQSLKVGANAYLPKDAPLEELLECILSVMNDRNIFYGETIPQETIRACNRLLASQDRDKTAKLSEQEINTLKMLSKGLSPKEISQRQDIAIATIESHKERIRKKTDCRTVLEMVIHAIKNNIISLD